MVSLYTLSGDGFLLAVSEENYVNIYKYDLSINVWTLFDSIEVEEQSENKIVDVLHVEFDIVRGSTLAVSYSVEDSSTFPRESVSKLSIYRNENGEYNKLIDNFTDELSTSISDINNIFVSSNSINQIDTNLENNFRQLGDKFNFKAYDTASDTDGNIVAFIIPQNEQQLW